MPSTSKSTKKAAEAVSPEFVDAITPLVLNSVERIADLQKKTLDVAAEQTAEKPGPDAARSLSRLAQIADQTLDDVVCGELRKLVNDVIRQAFERIAQTARAGDQAVDRIAEIRLQRIARRRRERLERQGAVVELMF